MENVQAPFDIKIEVTDQFLRIAANGMYSLKEANNLFKQAIDNGLLHNKDKILIDVTHVTGTIPFMDRFEFASFLASYRFNNAIDQINLIAVVGQEPVVHKDRFGETVAVNRGTQVRVFTDKEEALQWLQKK